MVVARESLAAARLQRRAALEVVRSLAPVHVERVRRRAAGWTLLLFATTIAFVVVVPAWAAFEPSLAENGLWFFVLGADPRPGLATTLLMASWPISTLVGAVAGRMATTKFNRRLARGLASLENPRPGSAREQAEDAYAALSALENTPSLAGRIIADVRQQEGVSVAAWLAGASLCLPLTVHLGVALAASTMGVMFHGPRVFADVVCAFDGWIALSGLVAHAMAATALYAVAFARRLPHEPEALPHWQLPLAQATGAALVFPTLLIGFHFGVLGLLPALLVLGTGAACLPVLYGGLSRALRRERFLVAAAEADVGAAERLDQPARTMDRQAGQAWTGVPSSESCV